MDNCNSGITVNIGGFNGTMEDYLSQQKTSDIEATRLASINSKRFKMHFPTTKGNKIFNPLTRIRKPNRESVLLFVNAIVKEFRNTSEILLRTLIEKYGLQNGPMIATYKKVVSRLGKAGFVAFQKGRGKRGYMIKNVSIKDIAGYIPSPVSAYEKDKIPNLSIKKEIIDLVNELTFNKAMSMTRWELGEYLITIERKK